MRRENVDAILKNVCAHRGHKGTHIIDFIRIFLNALAHARNLLHRIRSKQNLIFFVTPVCRNAKFGDFVHLVRTDLNLQRKAVFADHGGMQTAVFIGLGMGDVVIELPRHRRPQMMHNAQNLVALRQVLDEHSYTNRIIDTGKRQVLPSHLVVDAIDVFGTAFDLGRNFFFSQRRLQNSDMLRNLDVALLLVHDQQPLQLLKHGGIEIAKREVLQFRFPYPDAEPVRNWREDLQRFARHAQLTLRR